jgi:hypothetical protein
VSDLGTPSPFYQGEDNMPKVTITYTKESGKATSVRVVPEAEARELEDLPFTSNDVVSVKVEG